MGMRAAVRCKEELVWREARVIALGITPLWHTHSQTVYTSCIATCFRAPNDCSEQSITSVY